jgi:hypothetical protein
MKRIALCLLVISGVLACASPPEHAVDAHVRRTGRRMSVIPGVPSEEAWPSPQSEPTDLVVSTHEVRAQCDPGYVPGRNALFYAAVLARADGTVLAGTEEDGAGKGPLEIVLSTGTRCHAPIRCSAFIAPPSGEIWCLERQTIVCNGGIIRSGPARPQIGYTRDGGATWRVAEVDVNTFDFRWSAAPSSHGIVLSDRFRGQIWSAQAVAATDEIHLHRTVQAPPGEGGPDTVFFAPERVCSIRYHIGGQGPFEGALECLTTGAAQWVERGDTNFLSAVSTPSAWWALDEKHRLFRSDFDPSRWIEIKGWPELELDKLTSQGGTDGDIFVLAQRKDSMAVLRVDASGRVVEGIREPPQVPVTAFGAEGGRLAIGAPEGVYVLQRSTWEQVMPACGNP